jgi:glucose/arabinose dehydrogenase
MAARILAGCAALLAALLLAACEQTSSAPKSTETPPGTPVPPTPDASSLPRENGYALEPAVPSATHPQMLGLAVVPGSEDQAVLITQTGELRLVNLEGTEAPLFFGDISQLVIPNAEEEEGLLGIAFSPDYEDDAALYLYYSKGPPRRTVLSRFTVVDETLDNESEQVLLEIEQPYSNHKGGHIAFGPDGMLYLGPGDGGSAYDPQGNGQDLSDLLGSILRIDVSGGGDSYSIPPDNPFVSRAGALPEIYAYGLRNPWRFSFDRDTGDLWAGDVGQQNWEEVNRIDAGGNYGWKTMEGSECIRLIGATGRATCDRTGLIPPRTAYDHSQGCSITGGYVYRGEGMPELQGYYIYADFCTGNIWAVDTESEVSAPILISASEARVSSFTELPDGELLLLTYDQAIYKLGRAS